MRLRPEPGDLVLVTGAVGRIGANVCRALLAKGYRVRGLVLPGDPNAAKLAGSGVELVEVDLRDELAVIAACVGVDAIFHFAALMGPEAGDMPVMEYWRMNVDVTLHVLEGARHNGRIAKFVYASTDATYPSMDGRYYPIDEYHPQNPINLYGETKAVGERLCLDYLREFEVPAAVVRFGAVAVPVDRASASGNRPSSIAERFRNGKLNHNNHFWIKVRAHDRPWEFLDPVMDNDEQLIALTDMDGRPWVDHPTDVRDVVQGAILALESPAAVGEAFNVMGPGGCATTEMVPFLAEKAGLPWRTLAVPIHWRSEMSIAKARAVLGYTPQYDFFRTVEDGLAMQRGEDIGVLRRYIPNAGAAIAR